MHIAIDHPELVRKLVLATPVYSRDGFHPGIAEGSEQVKPEQLIGSPFHEEYVNTAPNPDDFPNLVAKVGQLNASYQGWPEDVVRSMTAPALLVAGDSDIVQPEHAVAMFRLFGGGVPGDIAGLPNSQLAVPPGTTQITLVHRADWLAPMIDEFLEAPVQ